MKFLSLVIILIYSLSLFAENTSLVWEDEFVNNAHLRFILSKIAPLEQWSSEWSNLGARVCWRMFRPNPHQLSELQSTISNFQGHSRWYLTDNCLLSEAPRSISQPQLSEAQAADDLLKLADQIEARLELKNVEPKQFSQDLLSKEGLRRSHASFEDFQDGGQRVVYLIVKPGTQGIFEPTKKDLALHFEPSGDEITGILSDILRIDLTRDHGRALTDLEVDRIKREFPVLWKISDYYEDISLGPDEVEMLLQECIALDKITSSKNAIRGLDKISRIAGWASKEHYGVLFSAP